MDQENESIDCPNYVYRDFNKSKSKQNFKASISIFPIKNTNQLEIQIDGIYQPPQESQDVYEREYKTKYIKEYKDVKFPQKTLLVTYSNRNIELYDIITTILNKITYDHKYYLQDLEYQDFILCSNLFAKTHVESCRYDITQNHARCVWMEFTRQNIQYLDFFTDSRLTSCNGDVNENGELVYEIPSEWNYIKPRGRCVWDIIYDYVENKYKLVNHTNRNILYHENIFYNYIYREFEYANIEIYVSKESCKLYVLVNHMHENEHLDYGACQAELIIDYSDCVPLYDVILSVLDKLTDDHRYVLEDAKYKDTIVCSDTCIEFTRDTLEHVELDYNDNDNDLYDDDKCERIILRGNVDKNCVFVYDYPIVSNTVDHMYYKATRGHVVWDIVYDDVLQKYVIDTTWR